jgi:hypothetical protein
MTLTKVLRDPDLANNATAHRFRTSFRGPRPEAKNKKGKMLRLCKLRLARPYRVGTLAVRGNALGLEHRNFGLSSQDLAALLRGAGSN